MEKDEQTVQSASEMIRARLTHLGVSQVELSVRMDAALSLAPGSVALAQTRYLVDGEMREQNIPDMESRRMAILELIKAAGGLWSFQGIPEHLDDDSIIEAALVHMDLGDMPMLFQIWSKSHLKRVWKERLVSQGKRMNILNYILAVKIFGVSNPDQYLERYGN